ncbi:MAG: DUF2070 family protein [Thermofilaceae archaeon]|nr:DUF2070 family protein [Thermofilaceae archaeon]
MDLKGFERGAKALFSFPALKVIVPTTLALSILSVSFGCSLVYVLYVTLLLPITLKILVRKFITAKRAWGLAPLFLIWGMLVSAIRSYTCLILIPPTLLLHIPVRFLSGSSQKAVILLAIGLLTVIINGCSITELTITIILSCISFASTEVFIRILKNKLGPYGGLELLSAYFSYILAHDLDIMENALKKVTVQKSVPVYVLDLSNASGVWGFIAIPHIHPGPFRDLGSSRLPSMLVSYASKAGLKAMVLHGASKHSEDLIDRIGLTNLVRQIVEGGGEVLCIGEKLGLGVCKEGGFRCIALSLECGQTIVLTERVDGGLEDIPLSLAEKIGENVILVDNHNSFDEPRPSPTGHDQLTEQLLNCVKSAITKASLDLRDGWKVGLATKLGGWHNEIGTAGVSFLTLSSTTSTLNLMVYDSNNMIRQFRDQIYTQLAYPDITFVTATTDTHELTGARAGDTYNPLGTRYTLEAVLTDVETLRRDADACKEFLHYRLRRILVKSSFLDSSKLEKLNEVVTEMFTKALLLLILHGFLFIIPFLMIV